MERLESKYLGKQVEIPLVAAFQRLIRLLAAKDLDSTLHVPSDMSGE